MSTLLVINCVHFQGNISVFSNFFMIALSSEFLNYSNPKRVLGNLIWVKHFVISHFKHYSMWGTRIGRAASGGALAPEPPRATRNQPWIPKTIIFIKLPGLNGLNLKIWWKTDYPPAPMNHVKYWRAGPAEMPFRNWYTTNTNHFQLTCQVEMKNPTRLSNKTSNALSYADDQILENKNLRNMILNICTERWVKYFRQIYLPVREHTWLIG